MNRRALTLVELLVSITLGMILVAMGSSALVQITRIAKRDTAQRQAHDDAAVIHRRLQASFGSLYHPAQMRVEAHPGPDGAWGSGDETLSMVWMASLRDLEASAMGYRPGYVHELVWHRLSWSGDGEGGGELTYATSSPERESRSYTYSANGASHQPRITATAQPRRDRRRDLDDNDLRFVPGMTAAVYGAIDLPGDGEDLIAGLRPMHPPTTEVARCSFEWVDAGGVSVRCDPATGVTVGGTSVGTEHAIDGAWLDGREHVPPGDSRSVTAQRPVLVRVAFELVPVTTSGLPLDQEPHLEFTFSFATAGQLPPL